MSERKKFIVVLAPPENCPRTIDKTKGILSWFGDEMPEHLLQYTVVAGPFNTEQIRAYQEEHRSEWVDESDPMNQVPAVVAQSSSTWKAWLAAGAAGAAGYGIYELIKALS